ncbi:pirin family protein [Polycladidibacter hongkongensis]|uniref:pirin family protein n=1 Tax=Polycladidibacter hongkongensis TaxID=1647556 RepID=UPI00082AAB2F|nr:pirin family protein [Pseudovibrio hongkongensis]
MSTAIHPDALIVKLAESRGHVDHGWLRAAHSFSFADYHDPQNIHFSQLRVINEDHIAPGGGFPTHPHRNFEIFTYPLSGSIAHKDSLGSEGTVKAGEIQYMSAGRGVHHSEFNPSSSEETHLLQIWLIPNKTGTEPRYEAREIASKLQNGTPHLFLSPDGREGSIAMQSDTFVYALRLQDEKTTTMQVADDQIAYIQIAKGAASINGITLKQGDALQALASGELSFSNGEEAELIVFMLPAEPEQH